MPQDLAIPGPYKNLPMLVQRDFVLYESNIINEYIDERMPHPNLMPVDPAMRARARLLLHGFEQELFCHIACRWQRSQVCVLPDDPCTFFAPNHHVGTEAGSNLKHLCSGKDIFPENITRVFIAIHVSLPIADY